MTNGRPVLTDAVPAAGMNEEELLRLAAPKRDQSTRLEKPSCQEPKTGIAIPKITRFQARIGSGIYAEADGRTILAGSRRLMESEHIEHEALLPQIPLGGGRKNGDAYCGRRQSGGLIAVADTIKETSPTAVKRLNDMGLDVIMMTGDNKRPQKPLQKPRASAA